MLKLVVFLCLVTIAVAHPSLIHEHGLKTVQIHSEVPVVKTKLIQEPYTIPIQEHTIEKVGEHVETIPTGVSHQSQTILHSTANKITPILAPAVRTHYQPAVRTIEKKFIEKVPVVEQYVEPTVVKTVHEAPIIEHVEHAPILKTFEHGPILKSFDNHRIIEDLEHSEKQLIFGNHEASKLIRDGDDSVIIDAPYPGHFEGSLGLPGRFEGSLGLPTRFEGALGLPARFEGALGLPARFDGALGLPARFEGSLGLPARFEGSYGRQYYPFAASPSFEKRYEIPTRFEGVHEIPHHFEESRYGLPERFEGAGYVSHSGFERVGLPLTRQW